MKQSGTKILRVQSGIGKQFVAVADLIGVDQSELLESILITYVESIKTEIQEHAATHPQFQAKYPFVQQ